MTMINRMVMKGFKSFDNRVELVFGPNYNVILGPNGAGKCLVHDSLVQLADGSLVKIGNLVEERIKEDTSVEKTDDGFISYNHLYYNQNNYPNQNNSTNFSHNDNNTNQNPEKTVCMNFMSTDNKPTDNKIRCMNIMCMDTKSLKIVPKPILAFVKRKSPSQLVNITTKTGRKITTTLYHPLFVLENGYVKAAKAEELSSGKRIAVPRKLSFAFSSPNPFFEELISLISEDDEIYVPFDERYIHFLKNIKSSNINSSKLSKSHITFKLSKLFTTSKLSISSKPSSTSSKPSSTSSKPSSSLTWKELAQVINIPPNAIKGLLDKQSINFAHLVKILLFAGMSKKEISELIPYVKAKSQSKLVKFPWHNSKEFSRLLGYLLAEGQISKHSAQTRFTNGSEELVADYTQIFKQVFDIESIIYEYKPNCWDVIAYSSVIQTILTKFGMSFEGTAGKTITNLFLKHSNEQELSELLNGLYSGDGYISKNHISITTKSIEMAKAIETILLRLDIIPNTRDVIKIATNTGFDGSNRFSGHYKEINVYGINNFIKFSDAIKINHNEKSARLMSLVKDIKLNTKPNPNLDLLEAGSLVKQVSKELKLNIKNHKPVYPKLDAYSYNQCTPSLPGITELTYDLFLPVANENKLMTQSLIQLKKLADSDILWDEIEEMEIVSSKEEWVYDLCVSEHHNFIANNFVVHNSNVMDALCFVLGKGSAKGMRAEKAANLIYNGGKLKNPAKQGEVHIYFNNEQNKFPSEESEIKISRIIRQNGQSIYKINDKTRTRQQILDLLGIASIDPDGYNIILQGDVIHFVEMSHVERRGVIEEIAGIGIYEEKKNKALNELAKVDQKLNEADIILSERKTYLKELKKDRDTALKYKELDDQIKSNKATYLNIQITQKKGEQDKYESQINSSNDEIKKLQEQIDELKKGVVEKKEQVKAITSEIEQKGEKDQVVMLKVVEQLKVDVATFKTRIISCQNEIQRVNTRKDQLLNSLKELEDKISELKLEQNEAEKKKQSMLQTLKEIEAKIAAFRKKNQLDGAEDVDKQIADIDKKAEEKEKEVQLIREEQQNLLREKDKLEFRINSIEEQITKVLEVEKTNKAEIDALKQKQSEFKKATLELNQILNEDSSLAMQLANAKEKLNKCIEELSALKAKNAGLRESAAMDMATSKILEQKNKLGEIFGMVFQLGEVESKYSLALEIAAGPKIKSIVVDSDKTAANCINYLKQNKLGTATFLPLNKIKASREEPNMKDFLSIKGVVGKAIDLVNFESKFKNVFSYVFGNTLVVDNIDVARRVGVGNIKMVTVDGDLSEMSGAMHGGFRQRERSLKFLEKEVVSRLKELETQSADTENLVNVLSKRKEENEEKITRLREFKASLEGEIIKTEKSLHLGSEDLDATKKLKKELKEQIEEADKKIMSINLKVSSVNKDLASLKIKKQELRDKIMQLRNPRLIAELNTFEQKKEQLKEELTRIESDIKNYTMQLKNILIPEQENISKIIKQHDKEIVVFNNETDDLNKKIVVSEKDLKEKEKKQAEFYSKFKELFGKRDALAEQVQKLETKIITSEEKIRGIEQRTNIHAVENARVKAEISALMEEFSKYSNVELFTSKPIEQIKKDIAEFEKMARDIGNVNMRALEVYDSVEKEYNSLVEKKDTLSKEKEEVLVMINEIDTKKKELFMKSFEVINANFQAMFSKITTKGEAFLEVENMEDPFLEGVGIKVRLTGKKFLDIRSLSGGEKTLTALAFLFSIQEHQPASFYVFDEVDAALDKRNSEKLAQLIKNYSDKAQYIIISHNDGIISEADVLYGVSMDEHNVSKVVSLKV